MANTKVTGDLIAGLTIATGNIADDAVTSDKISGITTAHIAEGSNLYYTNARADARITAATTSDLTEGTNLYYTDARADARAALLVDSAPSTLNTLNELAAALGDDPNFATTVTNSIATKLPLVGGTLTGNVLMGNTVTNPASGFADQTGIGLKYSTTVPTIEVSSDSSAMQLGRTSTGGEGQILGLRKAGTIIHNFDTNNVSIGTNATFGGTLTVNGSGGSVFNSTSASNHIIAAYRATNGNNVATFRTTDSGHIFRIHAQNAGSIYVQNDDGSNYIKIPDSGSNEVAGNTNFTGIVTGSKLVSLNGILELDDNGTHNGIINSPASLRVNIDSDSGSGAGESFIVGHNQTAINNNNVLLKVQDNGKVGINDNDPVNALEVKGTFAAPLTTGSAQNGIARFSQTAGAGSLDIGFGDPYSWLQSRSSSNYATNYNLVLQPNGGNVGIGITNPVAAKLHLEGTGDMIRAVKNANSYGPQMDLILNQTSPSNGDTAAYINMGAKDNSGNSKYWGSIRAVVDNIFTELGGFEFYTRAATDFNKRLKISAQGKVIVYQKDNVSGFYLDGGNTRLYANGGGGTDYRGIECSSAGIWSWGETGTSNYFAKKVGIGTTSINEKLEVKGNIRIDSRSKLGSGEVDNITFTKDRPDAATGTYEMGAIRSFTTNGYSGGMTFYCGRHTGGGGYGLISTMTIGHTTEIGLANVGIGTTTPPAKLTIISSGADGIQLGSDTSSTGNSGRIFWSNTSGGWAMMALGQVLSIRSSAVPGTTSGNPKVQLSNYSSTSWTASSDESLKENINSIGNVLDKIDTYRCVEYNLIDDETKDKKIGFIAQDWQEDFPQIVEQMEDEKIGMKYTETIPILLKAIQELKARIETLEN